MPGWIQPCSGGGKHTTWGTRPWTSTGLKTKAVFGVMLLRERDHIKNGADTHARTFWFGERGRVVHLRVTPDDSEVILVVSYSSLENLELVNVDLGLVVPVPKATQFHVVLVGVASTQPISTRLAPAGFLLAVDEEAGSVAETLNLEVIVLVCRELRTVPILASLSATVPSNATHRKDADAKPGWVRVRRPASFLPNAKERTLPVVGDGNTQLKPGGTHGET